MNDYGDNFVTQLLPAVKTKQQNEICGRGKWDNSRKKKKTLIEKRTGTPAWKESMQASINTTKLSKLIKKLYSLCPVKFKNNLINI